jgi:hypothetical protein
MEGAKSKTKGEEAKKSSSSAVAGATPNDDWNFLDSSALVTDKSSKQKPSQKKPQFKK